MLLKISTWYALGISNIAIVALYRILKRLGYYKFRLPIQKPHVGNIFSLNINKNQRSSQVLYFSHHNKLVSSPPNWFLNSWNNELAAPHKTPKKWGGVFDHHSYDNHWSTIPDFNPKLGDIKIIWELSRFDWLPKMAWDYSQGETNKLSLIELWLRDWIEKNPVNEGHNWKCGQETSFRCLNLIVASFLINDEKNSPSIGFLKILEAHIDRVIPTLLYAMAQDNNHGTSEAVALFVSGEFLIKYGNDAQKHKGAKYSRKGRYWIENRTKKLVMEDGSFSQHSVTYHRLFLDTFSLVELIRIHFKLKPFSKVFYSRMKGSVNWLYSMTDEISGDAPNIGANDGAYLFNLNNAEYRDFRPSLQLGFAVFFNENIFLNEIKHPFLSIFSPDNIVNNSPPAKSQLKIFMDGGYSLMTNQSGFAVMRLPRFKFRPSHADVHHVDIWHKGENIICDAGTFSYNTDDKSLKYFSGTESHNTIQFDNRDQMPRLGRFLYGKWLNTKRTKLNINETEKSICSEYSDYKKAFHKRKIIAEINRWLIIDEIDNFKNMAVLRWRFNDKNIQLNGNELSGDKFKLRIETDLAISLTLDENVRSLHYMQKDNIPVLTIISKNPGEIKTIIELL